MFKIIAGIVTFVVLAMVYHSTQLYTQDSKVTAKSGIIFTNNLDLKAYKLISNGTNWKSIVFLKGTYNNYSRSDRHDELVTVYCNKFCK